MAILIVLDILTLIALLFSFERLIQPDPPKWTAPVYVASMAAIVILQSVLGQVIA